MRFFVRKFSISFIVLLFVVNLNNCNAASSTPENPKPSGETQTPENPPPKKYKHPNYFKLITAYAKTDKKIGNVLKPLEDKWLGEGSYAIAWKGILDETIDEEVFIENKTDTIDRNRLFIPIMSRSASPSRSSGPRSRSSSVASAKSQAESSETKSKPSTSSNIITGVIDKIKSRSVSPVSPGDSDKRRSISSASPSSSTKKTQSGSPSNSTDKEKSVAPLIITANAPNEKQKTTRINPTPVAIKFGIRKDRMEKELKMFDVLKAINNVTVEMYGITAVYFEGLFVDVHPTIAITLCDESIMERIVRERKLNENLHYVNLLRVLYQAVYSLKYIHGKGILHQDLKPDNLMVRGTRLFVVDFNIAELIDAREKQSGGNRIFGSVSLFLDGHKRYFMDDLKSMCYIIIHMNGITLPWEGDPESMYPANLALRKINYNYVQDLNKIENAVARRVILNFYHDVMLDIDVYNPASFQDDERIPNYNKLANDILKGIKELTGSKDPHFEWPSITEKLPKDKMPSIEDIVGPLDKNKRTIPFWRKNWFD